MLCRRFLRALTFSTTPVVPSDNDSVTLSSTSLLKTLSFNLYEKVEGSKGKEFDGAVSGDTVSESVSRYSEWEKGHGGSSMRDEDEDVKEKEDD